MGRTVIEGLEYAFTKFCAPQVGRVRGKSRGWNLPDWQIEHISQGISYDYPRTLAGKGTPPRYDKYAYTPRQRGGGPTQELLNDRKKIFRYSWRPWDAGSNHLMLKNNTYRGRLRLQCVDKQ